MSHGKSPESAAPAGVTLAGETERARLLAEQLAATLDSITDAFITFDARWRFTYVNAQAERLLQRPRGELLGKCVWDEFPEAAGSVFKQRYELAVATGETVRFEAFHEPFDAWLNVRAYPSKQGLAVYLSDVSDRVRAQDEVVRLNALLEARVRSRTAQLEAANHEMEAFAYSIAHDLRAPLGSIDGFSQMLERTAGDQIPEPGLHYVKRIRAGVRQMAEITEGLLALASLSRTHLQIGTVDLSELARGALAKLEEDHPSPNAHWHVQNGLKVTGDSRLLKLAVENLLSNAWKFSSRSDSPFIQFGREGLGDGPADAQVYFVRDNGVGYDPAYAGKMFQAFQRMHPVNEYEGTGIGLAIVHKVIARHDGRVWATSAPHAGATFFFTLSESRA